MANLTIDIIYYKTASDFEMEFNLTGCCRMRLFKDKVDSPKELVNTLARDVSRSTITIIVTDLLGENSGIETISKAIRLPVVALDKANYGVKSTDEYMLPQTGVPLVTGEGIFGGCIVANGPQSIIIVSSNRPLRHSIMKAYVHNYVFDIGQYMAYQHRMGDTPDAIPNITPVLPNTNNQTVEQPSEETEIIETPDIVEAEPSNESDTVTETAEDKTEETATRFDVAETDEEMFEEDESFSGKPLVENLPKKTNKKRGRGSNVVLLIITVLLLIGFGVLAYFFVYLPLLNQPGVFTDGNGNIITEFLNGLFS